MRKLTLAVILTLATVALGGPALAHDVPNDTAWHTHDDGGGGHHKGTVFFYDLFEEEGLEYPVDGGFVDCPNATDKGLLAPGGKGAVHVAGICMNDQYVIHLLSGVDAPQGWETITYPLVNGVDYHYRLTPRG